jgi:hypothetical protein
MLRSLTENSPRQELRRRTNFRSVRRASMSASDVLAIAGAAAQGFGFAAVLYETSRIRRNELGYVGRLQRAWGVITDTLSVRNPAPEGESGRVGTNPAPSRRARSRRSKRRAAPARLGAASASPGESSNQYWCEQRGQRAFRTRRFSQRSAHRRVRAAWSAGGVALRTRPRDRTTARRRGRAAS